MNRPTTPLHLVRAVRTAAATARLGVAPLTSAIRRLGAGLGAASFAAIACATLAPPAAAQLGDRVALGAEVPTVERGDALRWLERLERDLTELRTDARRAHWRALADALIAVGDARGALLVARDAPSAAFGEWLRSAIDARLDADDESVVVALAHLLERFDAPDPEAARRERVRALCLVGRVDWARRAADGTTALLTATRAWELEGRARRASTAGERERALLELEELDAEAAAVAARAVLDAHLAAGAVDAALALFDERGDDATIDAPLAPALDEARGTVAMHLWDLGRRSEAFALIDPATSGDARAAEALAEARDVPSSLLEPLFDSLGRRDVDGRARIGRRLAHALAREGDGAAAWERAKASTQLDARARFLLARDLERGGDTRHATLLASSDRWSAALLETWRAHRDGRDGEDALERARLLAGEEPERAVALADLLLELGLDVPAAEVTADALRAGPSTLAPDVLAELANRALRADGGRRLVEVHDGFDSPALRCVLAAACLRAIYDRAQD